MQKRKKKPSVSWNNLSINQRYMLGVELLQQGVPKEWLTCLTSIERLFRAKMVMVKVGANKKTKN